MQNDEKLMRRALELAGEAAKLGEVPVGAVVALDGEIIAEAYNRRECDKNAIAHAELLAIDAACKKLGGWRLHKCDLYVTLEPCPMCAGAVMNSRLKRVVYGAFDDKNGACASVVCLFEERFTHIPYVRSRVLMDRCSEVLTRFFRELRENKL